jgi:hypothetical protein
MNPNPAIADVTLGVNMMFMARSGCPRCASNGRGAQSRKASAIIIEKRLTGFSSSLPKTWWNDEMMNAPATMPVM